MTDATTARERGQLVGVAEALFPLIAGAALGWWLLLRCGPWLVDDAFISFRYARHLAEGVGLTWNAGVPVEGYTNLLWVLLLTPFAYARVDLILPAALLGSAFFLATLVLMGAIAKRLYPKASPWVRALAPLFAATNLHWAIWSTSGMETASFAFWVLLAVHLAVEGRGSRRRGWALGLVFVAAYLTRPEGVMVATLIAGVELLRAWAGAPAEERRAALRARLAELWLALALLGLVVAVHVAIRLAYYGYPLPNTFYAKVIPGGVALRRGVAHVAFFLSIGGVFALPGLWLLVRRGGGEGARGNALGAYLGHGYALLFVYLAYVIVIGGDLPGWARFYWPLMPLPLLAWPALLSRVAARGGGRGAAVAIGLGLALLFAQAGFSAPSVLEATKGLRATRDRNVALRELFFRAHVPPDALLAIDAVGAFGYYLPNRIIDTWGLNDVHIAHGRTRTRDDSPFAHEKDDWAYVLALRPDFIIESLSVPPLRGYELCWPNALAHPVQIRRRSVALREAQRGLGMPEGVERTLKLPPPCALPYVDLDRLERFE